MPEPMLILPMPYPCLILLRNAKNRPKGKKDREKGKKMI
jgi:hypothetical protein